MIQMGGTRLLAYVDETYAESLFCFIRKKRPMKQKRSHGCIPSAKKDSCQSRCILARGSRKQDIYEGKQN